MPLAASLGGSVSTPLPSSALLHVKVFEDLQEFSSELFSFWQGPIQNYL